MATVIELVHQAIEKYGSILEAPENCEEFVKIRELSPDEDKIGSAEYNEKKKRKFLTAAKIIDLIDQGYTADMVTKEVHLNIYTVREYARKYGCGEFGKHFRWHAERNGIQYYSVRMQDLLNRRFKRKDIKQVKLLKFELPDGAHYCENGKWHIYHKQK